MDKNAIKKYAVWARRELIARVSQKAEQYGITEKEIIDERAENIHGIVLTPAQMKQRQALIHLVRRDGFQYAMEEIAYTWFNRFIALRFMEVNDYLPGHTRAFTDEQNAFKPKILSDALNLELTGLNLDKVIEFKETNKTEELYQYLLIILCNHLSAILPGMFQKIDDYTELLFPEHLLREGSVLEQLVTMIPHEDWLDAVQIIGWLYQYYIAEPKDMLINARKQYKNADIPFVTQLFTTDWIVRFMVENSLGRLWIEGHPNDDMKAKWKFYLEREIDSVEHQEQIKQIRTEYVQMKPEDILCIDPCSGSGHILVYLFDVLVQIYEAYGFSTRDAVTSIVQHNLWGIDIDDRAAQLTYFAVMMKARQYDKGWFRRGINPHVFALQNSSPVSESIYARFGEKTDAARRVITAFAEAKKYGSIIQPNVTLKELDDLQQVLEAQDELSTYGSLSVQAEVGEMIDIFYPMIQQARALIQKYNVVVTNPPYMSSKYMPSELREFVNDHYPDVKSDLFAVFIQRCSSMCSDNGQMGFLTPYVWMYIQSYEDMRKQFFSQMTLSSLVQLEYNAFEAACVPVATFTVRNYCLDMPFDGVKLSEFKGSENQEPKLIEAIKNYNCGYRFTSAQKNFSLVPGAPVAYWETNAFFEAFSRGKPLRQIAQTRKGMFTGDNDLWLKLWFEISYEKFGKQFKPYNKGGEYRKWYGNHEYVINWLNNGLEIMHTKGSGNIVPSMYFHPCLTWSLITSNKPSFRIIDDYLHVMGDAGPIVCTSDENQYYLLGLLNSTFADSVAAIIAPTINYSNGAAGNVPIIWDEHKKPLVEKIVKENINISRTDWDSFETSWDFQVHPIIRWSRNLHDATSIGATMDYYYGYKPEVHSTIELCYMLWQGECNERFKKLKANEEELNRIFIDIYGLQDELTQEVADKDVTVRKGDLGRDIRSLVSYAIGCMLGRYSLDKPGLAFAGGEWDAAQYVTYPADKDGVLPITDDDYFSDDVVSLFADWVKTVFGPNELEDNLKFIASSLYPNAGGTARELIRQYFLNDFYKDHLKIYQKRPIYWLFDAGKKNSFKCLVYLHRYRQDTVARVRTDYVHEMQARYRTAKEDLAHRVGTASGSERVRLQKQLVKIQGQEEELRKYEEKIHHYADMMLPLNLDDGVKVNYAKLHDVLAPIK